MSNLIFNKLGMRLYKEPRTWRNFGIWFSTGDREESSTETNKITVYGFFNIWYLKFNKPFIKPLVVKRFIDSYNKEFEYTYERKYGFSLSGDKWDFLNIYYGVQEPDWNEGIKEHRKSWFLPFLQWRHVYHHLLNLDGSLFRDVTKENSWEIKPLQQKTMYEFKDYDGEVILSTVTLERRRWDLGEGWFKWLSFFNEPMILTSLDIEFSSEVGKRKGSWKGGTIGTGIDLEPTESIYSAWLRFCDRENLENIRELDHQEVEDYHTKKREEDEKRRLKAKNESDDMSKESIAEGA